MDIIYALSFALSQMIKINEAQAIGLFSLAIKDANKKPVQLSYEDCRGVIQVQLKARLGKMNIANLDKTTTDMLKLLAQKQSLFVMSAR
jgi:hypothetical protein